LTDTLYLYITRYGTKNKTNRFLALFNSDPIFSTILTFDCTILEGDVTEIPQIIPSAGLS